MSIEDARASYAAAVERAEKMYSERTAIEVEYGELRAIVIALAYECFEKGFKIGRIEASGRHRDVDFLTPMGSVRVHFPENLMP